MVAYSIAVSSGSNTVALPSFIKISGPSHVLQHIYRLAITKASNMAINIYFNTYNLIHVHKLWIIVYNRIIMWQYSLRYTFHIFLYIKRASYIADRTFRIHYTNILNWKYSLYLHVHVHLLRNKFTNITRSYKYKNHIKNGYSLFGKPFQIVKIRPINII